MEKAYILTIEVRNYGGCCCEPSRRDIQIRAYKSEEEVVKVRDAIRKIVKIDQWHEKNLTKEDYIALKPYLGDRTWGTITDADYEEIDLVE